MTFLVKTKDFITNPKLVRDLFILVASFNLSPVARVDFYLFFEFKIKKLLIDGFFLLKLCIIYKEIGYLN